MAIPVARVHLKVARAALPALLPTPPKWKTLPLVSTPPFVASVLPKPPANKPRRADSDGRWDASKTKPAGAKPSANIVRSNTGHGSSLRKNVISPPPKPSRCRADSVERWDAHKKATSPPASSPSSSATSSLVSNSKLWVSRASSSSERSRSTGTSRDDIDDTEEEEILWKPRAMYAGPGFVVATPPPSMIPMPPTSFLVPVA